MIPARKTIRFLLAVLLWLAGLASPAPASYGPRPTNIAETAFASQPRSPEKVAEAFAGELVAPKLRIGLFCANDPINKVDPIGLLSEGERGVYRDANDLALNILGLYGENGWSGWSPADILGKDLAGGFLSNVGLEIVHPWGSVPIDSRAQLRANYPWWESDDDVALMEATRRNLVNAKVALAHNGLLAKDQVTALQMRGLGLLAETTLDLAVTLAPYSSVSKIVSGGLAAGGRVAVGPGVRQFGSPTSGSPQYGLSLHRDQLIMNNYQRYYNDAWLRTVGDFNDGRIVIPSGTHWKTVLGQRTDAIARARLRNFLGREGILEGPGMDVLVNRWLRDPLSEAYRIPDLRLLQTRKILDGTIGSKTLATPQAVDFFNFSGGDDIIFVRPTVGPVP